VRPDALAERSTQQHVLEPRTDRRTACEARRAEVERAEPESVRGNHRADAHGGRDDHAEVGDSRRRLGISEGIKRRREHTRATRGGKPERVGGEHRPGHKALDGPELPGLIETGDDDVPEREVAERRRHEEERDSA
jgi:hypothetical protein